MKRKAMLAAGLLTLQALVSPLAMAGFAQGQPAGEVVGFVVPSEVSANEPFTFAATGVVEGEVVSVQTLDGEVVQTKRADKLGRVFMAAGLAAGGYLLSAKGGSSSSRIQVGNPNPNPPGSELCISQPIGNFNAKQGLSLKGEGISPNAADMMATFGGQEYPVLASTAREVKTGPLPSSACGNGPVAIQNSKTGEVSHIDNVVCYELSAKLVRDRITGGEQTTLEFSFNPANLVAIVNARILSGPVSFANGIKEMLLEVAQGSGKLPLTADPSGQGPFRVAYNIHEILGAGQLAGPGVARPAEGPVPQGEKKKQCPKTKHIRDEATGWTTSEKVVPDPADPKKKKTIYVATRTIRCSVHKSCTRDEGHGGNCAFTGKHRCKVHTTTETREYDSNDARRDGMKDTAIPEGLKNP
jgi:hypothetical protein